jgi:hypothetical protein
MLITATNGKQQRPRVMVMQSLCTVMRGMCACTISVFGTMQTAVVWFMHKLAGAFVSTRW